LLKIGGVRHCDAPLTGGTCFESVDPRLYVIEAVDAAAAAKIDAYLAPVRDVRQ
jgi:hypothetical protein